MINREIYHPNILPKQEEFNTLRRFVDRLNAVVLPNQEFNIVAKDCREISFTGKLIINKYRIYRSSNILKIHLVVDVTILGYFLFYQCFKSEDEILEVMNQKKILSSYHEYSSKIIFPGSYPIKSKKDKNKIAVKVRLIFQYYIKQSIKMFFLNEQINKCGFIADVNYGTIKYE